MSQQQEEKDAYPNYNLNNPVDKYKKECVDELLSTVYYIEPRQESTSPTRKTILLSASGTDYMRTKVGWMHG